MKKKVRTMDIILCIIAVLLILFTLEMIAVYKETGAVPDTLVTCVFSALGGECGAMAWIKATKERNRNRRWEVADRRHEERKETEHNG